jgi:hypothetical protein
MTTDEQTPATDPATKYWRHNRPHLQVSLAAAAQALGLLFEGLDNHLYREILPRDYLAKVDAAVEKAASLREDLLRLAGAAPKVPAEPPKKPRVFRTTTFEVRNEE